MMLLISRNPTDNVARSSAPVAAMSSRTWRARSTAAEFWPRQAATRSVALRSVSVVRAASAARVRCGEQVVTERPSGQGAPPGRAGQRPHPVAQPVEAQLVPEGEVEGGDLGRRLAG